MVDDPFQGPVKLYCHRCQEVYASHKNSHCKGMHSISALISYVIILFLPSLDDIDGSFFTTTFPHLFFLTYNNLVPEKSETLFVPRVFGFKIHPSSRSNPQPGKLLDH